MTSHYTDIKLKLYYLTENRQSYTPLLLFFQFFFQICTLFFWNSLKYLTLHRHLGWIYVTSHYKDIIIYLYYLILHKTLAYYSEKKKNVSWFSFFLKFALKSFKLNRHYGVFPLFFMNNIFLIIISHTNRHISYSFSYLYSFILIFSEVYENTLH